MNFFRLLPADVDDAVRPLLLARALRAFVDGYVAVLLPAYLLALGFGTFEVGLLSTATLLGSALLTLAIGAWGHRFGQHRLLLGAGLLMTGTGLAFAGFSSFWPLLLVAFVGTINPSGGDVSVFLPLEHARLAEAGNAANRTALFARYALLGALFAAFGALASGLPDGLVAYLGMTRLEALRIMFVGYALVGATIFWRYRQLAPSTAGHTRSEAGPLVASRAVVIRLAALFSLDAFAGGLAINTLMALWLLQRFELSLGATGQFFFWSGLLSAVSQLAAPKIAQRIGLVNTMVFTHIPASLCLIAAALAPSLPLAIALLFVRALLSQMDVPVRSAFVMEVVTPGERAAAASFTAVPRSLASALGPSLGGALFAAGWLATPLLACGALKIAYDLLLWRAFRHHHRSGKD